MSAVRSMDSPLMIVLKGAAAGARAGARSIRYHHKP